MDKERIASLKRVLMGIKGAAKGFKKDELKGRLAPKADENPQAAVAPPEDAVGLDPVTMKPGEKDPLPMTGQDSEGSEVEAGEVGGDSDDEPEDKERARILKLIASVG